MGHLPIGLGAMMALAMSMDPHGMRMVTYEATENQPKETPADRERIAAAESKRKRKAEKRAKVRTAERRHQPAGRNTHDHLHP